MTLKPRNDPTQVSAPSAVAVGVGGVAALQVVHGPGLGETFAVSRPRTCIGRRTDCQVVVQGSTVSRQHCEIVLGEGGRLFVRDLGSSFGTKLNATRLIPGVLAPLAHGDVLTLGWMISLRVVPPAASRRRVATPKAVAYTDEASLRRSIRDEILRARSHTINLTLLFVTCEAAAGDGREASKAATAYLGEHVSSALRRRLGFNERMWRVGPAQFVIAASGRAAADAVTTARRIVEFAQKLSVVMSGESFLPCCGVGVGVAHPGANVLAAALVGGARASATSMLAAARSVAVAQASSRRDLETLLSTSTRGHESNAETAERPELARAS